MDDKYCNICGLELIKIEDNGFDTKTGEKNVKLVCPSDICCHYGVEHDYQDSFFTNGTRCSKCKKLLYIMGA